MTEHHLKCWPEYFAAIKDGTKTFEVRQADRDYCVGDVLILHEFEPCRECDGRGWNAGHSAVSLHTVERSCMTTDAPRGRYTDRSESRRVTYCLNGGQFGIQHGFVVMGLAQQ